jgi:predicted nucleic-acid-binding Zn-ribbon protein
MNCEHEYEVEEIEDVPGVDFHKIKDGALSKRWRYLKCKKCGHLKTEPVL